MKNIHRINGLIYITSEEVIKIGDWVIEFQKEDNIGEIHFINSEYVIAQDIQKKIILTDNKDLIKVGIKAITPTDEKWLNDNPSCEWVEVRKRFSDFTVEPFVGYELKLPTHQTIEEAADELTFNQLTGTDRDLAKGIAIKLALSQAARDYWYNIFKSEQQC